MFTRVENYHSKARCYKDTVLLFIKVGLFCILTFDDSNYEMQKFGINLNAQGYNRSMSVKARITTHRGRAFHSLLRSLHDNFTLQMVVCCYINAINIVQSKFIS